MDVSGSKTAIDDRLRFNGEFATPELERAYRLRHATHNQFIGRVIIGTAAVPILACGVLDACYVANRMELIGLWCARLALFVCSGVAFYLIRRQPTPAAFARILGVWYGFTVALQVFVGSVWSAGHAELRMAVAMAVLMSFCIVPVPLVLQSAIALLHTTGALLVVCWLNPSADATAIVSEICWLSLVNVFGAFLSYRLHVRQRLLFAAMLRQVEMSVSLSHALAEVKTLRGLIRVCAWCRKVDTGSCWQQFEAYVRDHSHAEFTHGICPVCMAVAAREAAEGPNPKFSAP